MKLGVESTCFHMRLAWVRIMVKIEFIYTKLHSKTDTPVSSKKENGKE